MRTCSEDVHESHFVVATGNDNEGDKDHFTSKFRARGEKKEVEQPSISQAYQGLAAISLNSAAQPGSKQSCKFKYNKAFLTSLYGR